QGELEVQRRRGGLPRVPVAARASLRGQALRPRAERRGSPLQAIGRPPAAFGAAGANGPAPPPSSAPRTPGPASHGRPPPPGEQRAVLKSLEEPGSAGPFYESTRGTRSPLAPPERCCCRFFFGPTRHPGDGDGYRKDPHSAEHPGGTPEAEAR